MFMKLQFRVARVAAVVTAVVSAGLARADPFPADVDPVHAPVPPVPVLRERLAGADYADRYAAALRQPMPDPAEPADGILLYAVDADAQPAARGLKAGEVICGVDGHPLHGQRPFDALRRGATSAQVLDVWSPADRRRRSVTVAPGTIGIGSDDYWRPAVAYVRWLAAGVKPADDLLVAARSAATDADLSETALSHARQSGATGPAVDLLAATTAAYDGRFDDALAFATAAGAAGATPDERTVADRLAYRAALATFRWAVAERVAAADPDALAKLDTTGPAPADRLPAAMAAFAARPAEAMVSPASALAGLSVADRSGDLANADGAEGKQTGSDWAADQLRHGREATFAEGADEYYRYALGPAGADVDLTVDCHVRATVPGVGHGSPHVTFALAADPGIDAVPAVSVDVHLDDGRVVVVAAGLPPCVSDVGGLFAGDRAVQVRLTAVGGRCRVALAGRPIFYGPVDAPAAGRQLCATVFTQAATGGLSHARWRTAAAGR